MYTLFFTEMWERMSYYGMRALLTLYMTAELVRGGLGLGEDAGAIYGLYTCAVYLVALPGGWIADRLLGRQRAVLVGGSIIALGHFTLAIRDTRAFFAGLLFIILGTALLKPNVSALVGDLYPEGGARRDAGFTLFYMGVNLGAFFGPLVCGGLAKHQGWHYGFAAAGVGMVLGLVQYVKTWRHLGEAGLKPTLPTTNPKRDWTLVGTALGVIALVGGLAMAGVITLNPTTLAKGTGAVILSVAALWFTWAFVLAGLTKPEKKRLVVIAILMAAAALFFSGFEQAGSVMTLFADSYTNPQFCGLEFPAAWYQSINPLLILMLAVPISNLWLGLSRRGLLPSVTGKFAGGLLLLGAGFFVMYFGARSAVTVDKMTGTVTIVKVTGLWLATTYFLHTVGELFLSPVGLSAVTKLAPARLTGQTLGIWYLASSLGNLLAGLLARGMHGEHAANMPTQFLYVAVLACGGGILLAVFSPLIRKLMPGVE
jgi:POT family proton-dependent oligopeptide transporter